MCGQNQQFGIFEGTVTTHQPTEALPPRNLSLESNVSVSIPSIANKNTFTLRRRPSHPLDSSSVDLREGRIVTWFWFSDGTYNLYFLRQGRVSRVLLPILR